MAQTQTHPVTQPEAYYIAKGELVPNNPLPALVYRDVLPSPVNTETARKLCEGNHWEKRGEWGAIYSAHFHPNTHECYVIIQGKSTLALGRERDATATGGVEVSVSTGDVVVVPAGVSHRSIDAEDGYRYIGVYPEECPKWRNDYCKGAEEMSKLEEEVRGVIVPEHDPVFGEGGPLVKLWGKARQDKL